MNNQMKMQNLKDRLKCGGTENELHDLTYFSSFVESVIHNNFSNKEWYVITFTDATQVVYNII